MLSAFLLVNIFYFGFGYSKNLLIVLNYKINIYIFNPYLN